MSALSQHLRSHIPFRCETWQNKENIFCQSEILIMSEKGIDVLMETRQTNQDQSDDNLVKYVAVNKKNTQANQGIVCA